MSDAKKPKAPNNGWWRGGTLYQIYPRSFQDSNGDGIGDLPGITARLPYVAALGVDAIWLSPFFRSPMKDFGYDVSDYCDVDPMFGNLDDFRTLVARAHELGLRVVIDQVLSHTSDQHPWFRESRQSRDNPRADWYVWADPKEDGTPPNNWLSIFGGVAWQWDTTRRQYFMHNFLASQPDLNFHNLAVQQALLDAMRFWLDLGVDGFRLDTANFYFHDRQLRDNPARGAPQELDPTVQMTNPYAWQWHRYDKSQPENLVFLTRLRELLDEYPDTMLVGELGDETGVVRVAEYSRGNDRLHMGYCFDLLSPDWRAPVLHGVFSRFEAVGAESWPCWSITNHDAMRVASRWAIDGHPQPALLRLAAAMQMSIRGTPCIYQGDELGLPEAELTFEQLQDPYGIAMWPEFKGRDGARTPIAWDAQAPDAGFGSTQPWLPIAASHRPLAVSAQERDAASLLRFYRDLLHWRRTVPALIRGRTELQPVHQQVLAYTRVLDAQQVLCIFNFSDQPVTWTLPAAFGQGQVLDGSGLSGMTRTGDRVELAPWAGGFLQA